MNDVVGKETNEKTKRTTSDMENKVYKKYQR